MVSSLEGTRRKIFHRDTKLIQVRTWGIYLLLDALQIKGTVRNTRGLCVWNIHERVGKEIRKCFGKRFCSYNLLIIKKKLRTECGKVDGCLFWSSDYQAWVINNLCWPNSLQHSNLPLLAIGLHHFELLFLSQVTYSQVLSICKKKMDACMLKAVNIALWIIRYFGYKIPGWK